MWTRPARQLIDAVVECDEALTEKYLTEGTVSVAELEADITRALDAGTLDPDLLHLGEEGQGRQGTARRPEPLRPVAELRQEAARRAAGRRQRQHAPARTDRAGGVRRAGVQGGQRQVRRAPQLHPRHRRQAPAQPQRREPAQRPDTARSATCSKCRGRTHRRFTRSGRATSSRIAKVEGLEIGDTIAYTNHAPQLPLPTLPDADVRAGRRAEEPRRRAEDLRSGCTRSPPKTRR